MKQKVTRNAHGTFYEINDIQLSWDFAYVWFEKPDLRKIDAECFLRNIDRDWVKNIYKH